MIRKNPFFNRFICPYCATEVDRSAIVVTDSDGEPYDGPGPGRSRRPTLEQLQLGLVDRCPHCRYEIHPLMWDLPTVTVALLGSTKASKSTVIAAMVDALLHAQVLAEHGVTVTPVSDAMRDYVNDTYWAPLFKDREIVAGTAGLKQRRQAGEHAVVAPLVFRCRVMSDRLLIARRDFLLCLLDAPGEDLRRQRGVAEAAPYLTGVDAAILVLDPQSFPRLADAWPDAREVGEEDPTLIANAGDVANLRLKRWSRARRVPLAIAIGKADLLTTRDDRFAGLRPHLGTGIDNLHHSNERRSRAAHTAAARKFLDTNAPQDLAIAAQYFNPIETFFLSATGGRPDPTTQKFQSVAPWGVVNPLAWALEQANVLRP